MAPEEIARKIVTLEESHPHQEKSWRLTYYANCLTDHPINMGSTPWLAAPKDLIDFWFDSQRRLIADLIREAVAECARAVNEADVDMAARERAVSAVLNRFGMLPL